MKWLNFKLYGNISDESKQLFQFTPIGVRNLELIEKQIAAFYAQHQLRIKGIFIFRFWQDINEPPPVHDHAFIPDRHYGELIRLRFRVDDADYPWAFETFVATVITPLEEASGAPPTAARGALKGWRHYEGYEARDDVGARFGDPAHGVDPTEQIVDILTSWTKYRFFLLEHPEFAPNHDLMNLYYNTAGLTYPQELDVLETRLTTVRNFMRRAVGL